MPAGHDAPHTYDAQVRITPALRVQEWIAVAGAKTAYIERGSPWENGYIESFNARSQGQTMVDAIRQIGVSEVTYYRWRQEFGKSEQVKRLKDLELENSRLRKAVSDLTLDKLILQEAARGNF